MSTFTSFKYAVIITVMLFACSISISGSAQDNADVSTTVPNLPTEDGDADVVIDNSTTTVKTLTTPVPDYPCPDNAPCENLGASCIDCKMNFYCVYGRILTAQCSPKPYVNCTGNKTFRRPYECRYSYQLSRDQYACNMHKATTCDMKSAPPETFLATCSVNEDVICLGNRTFQKRFPCNWTSGFKWLTALTLSVTLGGFGVDRFYLGMWKEGIGKLFSFGGLGVWTIVDVILIAVGYVGPIDSSLYMYPWDLL